MLKAAKSPWFEHVFAIYNRNLLKRRFYSFKISNINVLREQASRIIYVNHSSWWDGLIAFEISRHVKADSFVMMEEKQLKKLFLFRRLGAFSVVRENPRQAIESINYAVHLLRNKPNRTVWIFPQGKILPNDVRPLQFYRGLARIAEKVSDCLVIPCAVRYEFLGNFKPEVFVAIGKPEHFQKFSTLESKNVTESFENTMVQTLDRLKQDIVSGNTSQYEKLF